MSSTYKDYLPKDYLAYLPTYPSPSPHEKTFLKHRDLVREAIMKSSTLWHDSKSKEKETPVAVDQKSSVELIDDAVREAIEKPRREAEIARRVAAVEALGVLEDSDVGSVLTFVRKRTKEDFVSYVALKYAYGDDARWIVNSNHGWVSGLGGYDWKTFLEWMTTGPFLVENVRLVSDYTVIL